MIIQTQNSSGLVDTGNLCLSSIDSIAYIQDIKYAKTLNGKTHSYDRGVTSDKFQSSFTIQDFEEDVFELSNNLNKSINQILITTGPGELIFGAGIDYTNPILCNLISKPINFPQIDNVHAEIGFNVQAISTNGNQLSFKDDIPLGLPALPYQAPLERTIERYYQSFVSADFGSYGQTDLVDSSGNPIHNYDLPLKFLLNEADTARVEKFVSLNRNTPFELPETIRPNLFEEQDSENVIMTEFSSNFIKHDLWEVNMTVVSNV